MRVVTVWYLVVSNIANLVSPVSCGTKDISDSGPVLLIET